MALDLYNAVLGWLVATVGDGLLCHLREDPVRKALRGVVEEAVDATVAEIAPYLDSAQAAHLRASLLVPACGIGQMQVSNNELLRDALHAWTTILDQPEFGDVGYLAHLGVKPDQLAQVLTKLISAGIAQNGRSGGPLKWLAEWLWRDDTTTRLIRIEDILHSEAKRNTTRGGLPGGTPDFIGRDEALEALHRRVEAHDPTGAVVAIHAVDGMAGVGKTALAVHAAHQCKTRYPDGHFFIDLHGYTPGISPITPEAALEELLRQAEMPDPMPSDIAGRRARWCSIMSQRRAIVLLDNALDAGQVHPLLPMAAGCLVLITSRSRMAGLPGVRSLSLDVLQSEEAVALFTRLVSDDRCMDTAAVAHVTRLVGQLPLAVEMIAGRMRAEASLTLAELVTDLASAENRLDETSPQNTGVRAAFAVSVLHMDDNIRQAFRMLGVHPGPVIGAPQFAALAGILPADATRSLRALAERNLVRPVADLVGHRRYELHDLVRDFVREETGAFLSVNDQSVALTRLTAWYKAAIETVERLHDGEKGQISMPAGLMLANPAEAQHWMVSEQSNILAFATVATTEDAGNVIQAFTRWLFLLRFHIHMPHRLVAEFTRLLQLNTNSSGKCVSDDEMLDIFTVDYLSPARQPGDIKLLQYTVNSVSGESVFEGTIDRDGVCYEVRGVGIGPISAFVDALLNLGISVRVLDFTEHVFDGKVDPEAETSAIAYIECAVDSHTLWGVGIDSNTVAATYKAVISAVNRSSR